METLTIRRPDDMHVHLRQGAMLRKVAPVTARVFGRALVMPNTKPPVLTGRDVNDYRHEILSATMGLGFQPLMTFKVTDATTPNMVRDCAQAGARAGKVYPVGMTTNSEEGISDFQALLSGEVLDAMQECGLVLCLHGESAGITSLERERHFAQTWLRRLAETYPDLRIVLEHATDRMAVEIAREYENVGVSVTLHHLILTIDDIIGGSLDCHSFCKPVAKTEEDREYLVDLVTSGRDNRVFFGSDSAPHTVDSKQQTGAAGIYTAPIALEALAEIFETAGRLENLEGFTSINGARFYRLPLNEGTVTLKRDSWVYEGGVISKPHIRSFGINKQLDWRLA